jgi:hypothetical protein
MTAESFAPRVMGPIEEQCRRELTAARLHGPMSQTLAQSALTLARHLDDNTGGTPAAIARELRETLKTLSEVAEDDADAKQFTADMSTPVLNSEN